MVISAGDKISSASRVSHLVKDRLEDRINLKFVNVNKACH